MKYTVSFFKERQKFSAAHFTLFSDGEVERLHGHNYTVAVHISGDQLEDGLLFPFHLVKPELNRLCETLDERVLLPAQSPFVHLKEDGANLEVKVKTDKVNKFYSFPRVDCVVMDNDNISCENLAVYVLEAMTRILEKQDIKATRLEVALSESSGQTVTVSDQA